MSRTIKDVTACREALARLPELDLGELRQRASAGSTFNPATGPWFKPDNNTAHLLITFDLTAVPELTSLVLLASGLLRLGLIGRRKRAAHAA